MPGTARTAALPLPLRHVGVSLGALQHWHDGLGEFSRRLAEGLAERADELRRRDAIQLHLHLPRRWHGLFGERLGCASREE